MHIVVSTSALQLIRYIRSQGPLSSIPLLPEVEDPAPVIHLPTGDAPLYVEEPASHYGYSSQFDLTLEDAHFPFDSCVSNKRVRPPIYDDDVLRDFRENLKLGVFDIKKRAYRKTLRTYLLRKDLPSKGLIWVDGSCCFASPELTVVQLAAQLDTLSLAQVIMELTGYYSLAPTCGPAPRRAEEPGRQTAYNLPPVTTLARIRGFASHVRMMRDRRKLDAALDIALERSASPAESILATVLHLPLEQGGYGFETPLLNPQIAIPEHQKDFVSQANYYPDIFFKSCLADLEYESTSFHLDPITANWAPAELKLWRAQQSNKAERDRIRARELEALGLHVVPVVWSDLYIRGKLDRVAWALARRMENSQLFDAEAYMKRLDSFDLCRAREQTLDTLLGR